MRLAPESHKRIESFLRHHLQDENLRLPSVRIYSGCFSHWVTRTFGILAITFGRRVFVAPKVLERDAKARLRLPARLMAHEATHVIQYQRAGFSRFLVSYLREYARELRAQGGRGKAARQAAYFAITQEQEAYAAERAYTEWAPRVKRKDRKHTSPQHSGTRKKRR